MTFALMLNNGNFDYCECCLDPTHVWRLNVAAPSVNFFTWCENRVWAAKMGLLDGADDGVDGFDCLLVELMIYMI